MEAGADDFLPMDNADAVAASACTFDFILDTSPAGSDPATYLNLLKFEGKLIRVGIPSATEQEVRTAIHNIFHPSF